MFWQEPWFIAVAVVCVIAFIAFLLYKLLGTMGMKAKTGSDELIGVTAIVRETLNPEGTVFYRGDLWNAVSEEGRIEVGESVIVCKMDGLKLFVLKAEKEACK